MASKLIELRQRMRGYQPVRTAEEGDGELDSSSASDSDASSGPQRDMHPPRRLRREGAGVRRAGGASVASMELNFDDFPDTEEAPSTWRRLAKTLGFHRETLQSSPSDRGIGTNSRSSNESNACKCELRYFHLIITLFFNAWVKFNSLMMIVLMIVLMYRPLRRIGVIHFRRDISIHYSVYVGLRL
jgi:hypothetical protein